MKISGMAGSAILVLILAACSNAPKPNKAMLDAQFSSKTQGEIIFIEGAEYIPKGREFIAQAFCRAASVAYLNEANGIVFLGGLDKKSGNKHGWLHMPKFRFKKTGGQSAMGLGDTSQTHSFRKMKKYERGVFHVEDTYTADEARVYSVQALNADCTTAGYS